MDAEFGLDFELSPYTNCLYQLPYFGLDLSHLFVSESGLIGYESYDILFCVRYMVKEFQR